jgi:hypothetical protein
VLYAGFYFFDDSFPAWFFGAGTVDINTVQMFKAFKPWFSGGSTHSRDSLWGERTPRRFFIDGASGFGEN